MGKRRRESDSDDATAAKEDFTTVFIDTSLDTHFAMLISSSDTVSDLKKKIISEHMQFFPAIGGIKIQALKVKRRSNFYHLPDVMLVWNALQGLNGNWYLSVDATSGCVDVKDAIDHGGLASEDTRVRNEVSGIAPLVNLDKPLEKISDTCSEGNRLETECHVNKKRKMHTEDACDTRSMGDNCTPAHTSETYVASEPEDRPGQDVPKESTGVTSDGSKRKKKEPLAVGTHSKIDVEQTGRSESARCCSEALEFEEKEENKCLSLSHELEVTALSNKDTFDNAAPDPIQNENLSLPVLDAPSVVRPEGEGGNCSLKKKKKTMIKNRRMEKGDKSNGANHGSSDIKQAVNGTSGSSSLVCPPIDNIPKTIDEEENTLKGRDVRMQLLDGSCNDANKNSDVAGGNEADVVIPTQTSLTLEEAASVEKVVEKIQTAPGNAHEEFVPVGKDDFAGFSEVDRNGNYDEDKDRKAKKKRKKVKLNASDVKMKDADMVPTLSMATSDDAHEKNHVSSDVKNDGLNVEAAAENSNLNSNQMIENASHANLMTRKIECEPGQDVPTESWGVGSNEVPDHNARLTDTSGAVEDVSSKSSRKKKKKSHKVATEMKDNSHMEQTGKVENNKLHTEAHKPEENKEDKSMPLNHDHEVTISSVRNASDSAPPNPENEIMVAHSVGGADISDGSKRKRRNKTGRNSTVTNLEKTGLEKTMHSNEESGLHHKGEDVQLKLSDCPSKDAGEKFQGADENEANLVVLTQNSQMVEDIGLVEKALENAKSCGNTENEDKKSKKKRKKVHQVALDTSENLPVAVREVGFEASATADKNLVDVVTSEKKKGKCGSSTPSQMQRGENQRKKREQQSVNAVNKMVTKTSRNANLLVKPGAIFEDNSGESSDDDENGTLYSASRTKIPADSSSESSDSQSESELSQDTTGNGPIDSKEPSIGGGRSVSDCMEVTMDMILRGSKVFKNAKLAASQNEGEDMEEYVAETQVI